MRKRLWLILSVLGLAAAVLGAARGEMDMVWRKAIRICLECIGIG